MTYPRHFYKHPGPYGRGDRSYAIAGADDEEQAAALAERGWHATKEAAWGIDPLDHDGDGEKGGSKAAPVTDGLAALRAAYQEKMGKRAFPGWGADELRKRIDG